MDGQIRRRAVIKLLPFFMIVHGSLVVANDSENPKQRDVKMYMSPRLEKEFLGAVSVDLRFEESNGQPQRCRLKLFSHSDTSANGLKSTTVAITLKAVSSSAGSSLRDAYDQGYITYDVSGLPSEVLMTGDALQLKLAAKGGNEETAQLLHCGRDGKPSRRIELTLAVIPDEAETIGPEKGQSL
jgi:hypothetical protein